MYREYGKHLGTHYYHGKRHVVEQHYWQINIYNLEYY